jgi:hypothetical protein
MLLFWYKLRWSIAAVLCWPTILSPVILFVLIGHWTAVQLLSTEQSIISPKLVVWDALFVVFAGPTFENTSLIALIIWFVPSLLFFFFAGQLVYNELVQHGYAILLRTGSRRRWWVGQIALLMLLVIAYIVLGALAVLAGAFTKLPWSWEWKGGVLVLLGIPETVNLIELLGWAIGLNGGSLLAITLWQSLLALVLRHPSYSLISVVMIVLISWILSTSPPLIARWLPGSHSLLLRHNPFAPQALSFSLEWSAAYLLIISLLAIIVGDHCTTHMDIFGSTPSKHDM